MFQEFFWLHLLYNFLAQCLPYAYDFHSCRPLSCSLKPSDYDWLIFLIHVLDYLLVIFSCRMNGEAMTLMGRDALLKLCKCPYENRHGKGRGLQSMWPPWLLTGQIEGCSFLLHFSLVLPMVLSLHLWTPSPLSIIARTTSVHLLASPSTLPCKVPYKSPLACGLIVSHAAWKSLYLPCCLCLLSGLWARLAREPALLSSTSAS